jgi:hypothetical protein
MSAGEDIGARAAAEGGDGGRPAGGEALTVLRAVLDEAAAAGCPRAFWWRDDDAVDVGPRLNALVRLSQAHAAPISLAVIPAFATEELLALCEVAKLAMLQHGVRHANRQAAGKAAELGDAREASEIAAECRGARERLARCSSFVPVMVPPWNRMRPDLAPLLAAEGYVGVSLFGGSFSAGPPRRVDAHIDPVAWRGDRGLLPPDRLAAMTRRALATEGPVGLLTHHAVHDAATDAFVAAFVALVSAHPGAVWRDSLTLFAPLPAAAS